MCNGGQRVEVLHVRKDPAAAYQIDPRRVRHPCALWCHYWTALAIATACFLADLAAEQIDSIGDAPDYRDALRVAVVVEVLDDSCWSAVHLHLSDGDIVDQTDAEKERGSCGHPTAKLLSADYDASGRIVGIELVSDEKPCQHR